MSELTAVAGIASWLISRAEILPSLAEEYAAKFAAANITTIDELQAKGTVPHNSDDIRSLLSSNSLQWPRIMTSCSH